MRLFERHIPDAPEHVAQCDRCRATLEDIEFARVMLDRLPRVQAPERIWHGVEAALARPRPAVWRWRPAAAAAAVAVLLAAGGYWAMSRRTAWDIVRIHGAVRDSGKLRAGQWIETDASSRALVSIGTIGTVEVAPNSRVRVLTEKAQDHRLALARGQIHATISAPPRLFFVETAAGTAVDLGCEYSLQTDENGTGILQVTRGWVSFAWKGLESLVPAGASCRTSPEGPGLPYFDDAPERLKEALDRPVRVADVLAAARVRDTLTLWHLLWRVAPADRERVYDRMAALAPVPAGVSREMVLKLDAATLARWKDELAWTW